MFSLTKNVKKKIEPFLTYFLLILVVITVWFCITEVSGIPDFILPGPLLVVERFWMVLVDGQLLFHFSITLIEVIVGLLSGTLFAISVGYLLSKSERIERYLSPVIVASQAIPIVAVAPLLVIWFGPGLFSKILVCAIIIFFPVLVNTLAGLKNIPKEFIDLFRTLNAGPYARLRKLEIPASLPSFFTGMRVGATLSVTGAVVGEFIGADMGLGYLINVARGQYDTALVVVVIFVLVFFALSLYHLVLLLEHIVLAWKE